MLYVLHGTLLTFIYGKPIKFKSDLYNLYTPGCLYEYNRTEFALRY